MSTKIFYDNKFDEAVVTAATQNVEFPVTNLQDSLRSSYYETGVTQAGEYVQAVFPQPVKVDCIIVLDHNLQPTDTNIKVQGFYAAVAVIDEAIPYSSDTLLYFLTSTAYSRTLDTWRFIFTKDAAAETRQMSRIFLGEFYEMVKGPDLNGISFNPVDPSELQKAIGQQTYAFVKTKYDRPTINFSNISADEMDVVELIGNTVGRHTSFFLQIGQDQGFEKVYYCKFQEIPKKDFTRKAVGPAHFNTTLAVEEQL